MSNDSYSANEVATYSHRAVEGARRREYRFALAAGLFAVWATITSVAAWNFYQETERLEEGDAQARLVFALDALDRLMLRMADDLRTLPDLPSRPLADLLEAAEHEFVALDVAGAESGPHRRLRQADVLIAVSNSHLALGQPQRAAAAARRALDHLAPADRMSDDAGGRIAAAHIAAGDAAVALEAFEDAIAAYRAATAIRERASTQAPGNAELRDALARAYEREGQAHDMLGGTELSAKRFEQALAIRLELAAERDDDPSILQPLAIAYSNLGDHLSRAGAPDGAIEQYNSAIAIFEKLSRIEPDNEAWHDARALHLARLGRAHVAAAKPVAGLELLDEAAETYRALVEARPDDRRWQSQLADVLTWTGAVKLDRRDYPGARAAYTRALDIRRLHAERDPGNLQLASGYAALLMELAKVDIAENIDDLARLRIAEAVALRRQVLEADPTSPRAAAQFAEGLATAAEFGISPQRHLQEALEVLKQFAVDDHFRHEHEPIAEEIRQRLASYMQ